MKWHERGMDTVHDEHNIKGFFEDYRWLSNFHECPVEYEGLKYSSSEAAFQATKVKGSQATRELFTTMSPSESKKVGRNGIQLRDDWEQIKLQVMKDVLVAKFTQNEDLKEKLLATGNKFLEETNWWKDTYWGVCNGVGANHLGRILMEVRDELKSTL